MNLVNKWLAAGSLSLLAASANAAIFSYGFEDGTGDVMATFGSNMEYTNSDAQARTGNRSLKVEDIGSGNDSTPNATVAWITGLNHGDEFTASFWIYDSTASSPSARIWGHYTDTDINDYSGSAGGNNTYSSQGWSQLSQTFTFNADGGNHGGLALEIRFYDSNSAPTGEVFVDDILIDIANPNASVTFAGPASAVPLPAAAWLFGSALAGIFGLRRRK